MPDQVAERRTGCRLGSGFDLLNEFSERKDQEERKYAEGLARHRLNQLGVKAKLKTKIPNPIAHFDPATHLITAPTQATFLDILKRRGIKYTCVENATTCPIHDEGL